MLEPKWTVDLLEKLLGSSPEASKRALHSQILTATVAPGQPSLVPWSQHRKTTAGAPVYSNPDKACLPAVRDFCRQWLGSVHEGWTPYNRQKPPAGVATRRLVFPKHTVRAGVDRIRDHLDHDTPVCVGLARYYGVPARKGDHLRAYHWVAIVARTEGDVFLYLDPWPGPQSQCKYKGKSRIMMGYIFHERRVQRKDAVLLAPDIKHPHLPAGGAVIRGA